MAETEEHYSYRVYSDPKTAREFDADRFGGPVGNLIRTTQENVVFSTLLRGQPQGPPLPDLRGWKVIDVGAGTGRFSIPLLNRGAEVTACDASHHMLDVLREKTDHPNLQIVVVDAHRLEFPDQSFDCAFSFRMLLHVIDWKKALDELCRVSRDWVVFDLPPRHGFLIFAPVWHKIKKLFVSNVQEYRTFPMKAVREELKRNGFHIVSSDPGFYLPLSFYRFIGSAGFMKILERFFSALGLTRLAGSPVTLFARRKK